MAHDARIVRAQEVLCYLEEILRLGNKTIDRLEDHHEFLLYQNELPNLKNIDVDIDFFKPEVKFLTVKRPDLPPCPPVPEELEGWLKNSTDDPEQGVDVFEVRNMTTEEEHINFHDDPKRSELYREYLESWRFWAEGQNSPEDDNPFMKFLGVPALPDQLKGWVEISQDSKVEPKIVSTRVMGGVARSLQVGFNDQPERVQALQEYRRQRHQWAQTVASLTQGLQFHDYLFRIGRNLEYSEDLELVLGYGIILWEKDGHTIKYPLVTQNMLIQHDVKQNVITVVTPDDYSWRLETEPLLGLDQVDLQSLRTAFQNIDYLAEEENPLAGLLQQAVALASDGELISWDGEIRQVEKVTTMTSGSSNSREGQTSRTSVNLKPTPELRIIDGWVLFVRKKNQHALLDDIHAFQELLLQKDAQLPGAIAKFMADPEDRLQEWAGNGLSEWEAMLDPEILFPKPFNEEQIQIVQSLQQSDGVVVQGPPGTGKSHTIANLMAYFMAHGQRVLVTSQKDQALKVLHNMLPEALRPLCMPLLKNDSHRKQKLEQAIDVITDIVTNCSLTSLEKEIQGLLTDFENRSRDIRDIANQLQRLAATQLSVRTPLRERDLLPAYAAQEIKKEADHFSWFTDKPAYDKELVRVEDRDVIQLTYRYPFTEADLHNLIALRAQLWPMLKDFGDYKLPESNKLIRPDTFIEMANDLARMARLEEKADLYYPDLLLKHRSQALFAILPLLEKGVEMNRSIRDSWAARLVIGATDIRDKLTSILETLDLKFKQIELLYSRLDLLKDVQFKAHIDLKEYRQIVLEVLDRLDTGKKAIGMLHLFGGKKKAAIQEITVNGQSPESVGDWRQVENYLNYKIALSDYCFNWSALTKAFSSYPIPQLTLESDFHEIRDTFQLLRDAFDYYYLVKPHIQKRLETMIMGDDDKIRKHLDRQIENIYQALKIKQEAQEFMGAYERYQRVKDYLTGLAEDEATHPMIHELLDCLPVDLGKVKEMTPKWEVHYQRILSIEGVRPVYIQYKKALTKVREEAPGWGEMWLDPSIPETGLHLERWQQAWDHAVLNAYLDEIAQHESKMATLEELLNLYQRGLTKIKEKLIVKKTELGLIQKITEADLVSLKKWKNAMKRLGKGTGKYAATYQKEAQMHMQDARNAVPVWIMPVLNVSETIGREFEFFDVVIVDEASQCDLKSLLVLFRGKKVIVVGDDQQISPSGVGVNKEQMAQLIKLHLRTFPHASMMELETSLYDLAQVAFHSRANIMLKEHFRCVPEIIQFSNQLSYNGNIQPLRNPPDTMRLKPTLQSVLVTDGKREEKRQINKPEAVAICAKVKELVHDPRYAGKTIGVISLTGSDQAKYILDLIDQYITPKEQEEHAFHAGDSYAFQGDERDVMILSMVVDKGRRFNALTSDTYRQRYNVAVSRAKDQLILFHSIELGTDLTNPDDLRYQLLSYVQHGMVPGEGLMGLKERCETTFEEDVFEWLVKHGYRVTPQVVIGQYQIQLVVEGQRDRLAIECDGDQYYSSDRWWDEKMRQRQLERAGWSFARVSGANFYRNPNLAMEPVLTKLVQMGIEPMGR